MPNKNSTHFPMIFWYLVGCTAFTFLYLVAITFLHIPKENLRFADAALSFLMGTVVGGAFGYLVAGTPDSKRPPVQPGTTTAEISANIVTEQKDTEHAGS